MQNYIFIMDIDLFLSKSVFTFKDNSGKSSKKRAEGYKNSSLEGDEEWLRLSEMHRRYFKDLMNAIIFSPLCSYFFP